MVSQAFRKMRFKKKIKNRFPLIALHSNCDSPALIGRRPSSGTAAAMRCFGGIAFPLPPPAGVCCKVLFASATSIRCFLILYTDYTAAFFCCQYRFAIFRILSLYINKLCGIIMHMQQKRKVPPGRRFPFPYFSHWESSVRIQSATSMR